MRSNANAVILSAAAASYRHYSSALVCHSFPRAYNIGHSCGTSSIYYSSLRLSSESHTLIGAEMASTSTRYRISANCNADEKWISVGFGAEESIAEKVSNNTSTSQVENPMESSTDNDLVPESVLQYERQLRKIQASDRASKTNVTVENHLHVIHVDDHVVVTNKPSGILCVPGVNKYKSLLDLVFEIFGAKESDHDNSLPRDSMIVHRLDMDTSGVVVFARTRLGMTKLHEAFRERSRTKKMYEALLIGWFDINAWIRASHIIAKTKDTNGQSPEMELTNLGGGEIHLPLQRDHKHPPFMRVSTPESESEARSAVKDLNHAGWKKIVAKRPKPSSTQFRIVSHETWMGHPVTRVELMPITGRTHQLRVHCAAIGHPILGDPAYGYCGEANPNGGFSDSDMKMSPTCARLQLRRDVEVSVRENGRTMCLHAKSLGFDHPASGKAVSFEAPPSF